MTSAPTETTTTPAPAPVPGSPARLLGRFDTVEIRTRAEALAMLVDGSAIVKVSDTAEILYSVRRFIDDRDGRHVLLVKTHDGHAWRELDPAWQLPATIIYTPQN